MKHQLLILICTASFLASSLKAQVLSLSTNYRSNWQVINPAAINDLHIQDKLKNGILNLSARRQWLTNNMPDAPFYSTFRYEHYPNNNSFGSRIKWGVFGTTGMAGAISSYKIQGNLAVILPIDQKGSSVSLGGNLGVIGNNIDESKIRFAGTQQFDTGNLLDRSFLDLDVGVFYRQVIKDRMNWNDNAFIKEFYVGLSIPQIAQPLVSASDGTLVRIEPQLNLSLLAGIVFPILKNCQCNSSFLETSVWIRSTPGFVAISSFNEATEIPLSADFNLKGNFSGLFWAGIGYSTYGMLHTEAGFFLKDNSGNSGSFFLSNIGISYSFPVGVNSPFLNFVELNFGFAWKQD